ncbi:MAG: hypothetical protein A3J48_04010 [Candidatus Doudnabacteria bacterium RIFCSPHIGHO2_02_FULL_46_11]|uniref:GerMN domain-containing protein n=1 Tax=Candidatus Doudnabacteria bacterium RIFCSPHIGHO2_02_FULL_46_11 TaxID=1817832 RepID=A0A1F5P824_9BACT|nr:MAG: hypothetical protein A3J48_04010 [Candidatus Doudnabacteria bacterium RIFCSPHIGHO2_02_FULL_46_11]
MKNFSAIIILLAFLGGVAWLVSRDGRETKLANETAAPTRTIQLYYYNQTLDPGGLCQSAAVQPVIRHVPITSTPIQDAVKLLLQGERSSDERARGFTTEFPLEGVELAGANLENGFLTLEFKDPQNKTTGGSCRVSLLWAQIEKTALQFEEVEEVHFIPEELFQP